MSPFAFHYASTFFFSFLLILQMMDWIFNSTQRELIFAMLSRQRFSLDFGENLMKIEVWELDQKGRNG